LARLRATVDLVKTLPTLSPPRDLRLTPRMVRRPMVLTSAAFSAVSAAAAVILLIIGAALFTTSQNAPASLAAPQARSAVAALPTVTELLTSTAKQSGGGVANNSPIPLPGTQGAQAQNDFLSLSPTATAQFLFSAQSSITQTESAQEAQAEIANGTGGNF